ncbi:LOW QUALITY PROTEIN: TSC complex subunit 1a [Acanthochromis polyacanthus]|uniref:LOW QUALITY PROTEIN: TSC complex subunit 1a n=1 Tax=Acanthochromis polyacanthus TaxID=80966 RepID=UPI0022342798|nr:LOW QUALITY PROTEIN: TSC complex subunit 1a [Acanthochromis polyacanthus]
MSKEQVSINELLLSLDSSELQEAEQVRAAVSQQLSTDRGGAVLSSLVEHYLDSLSPQVVFLLSSIREPHHKLLLEKLNESLSRPGSRLAGLTLLGHLIRKQPPWVHHISRSALLASLLRCLKTDSDVVVLISGVLVLITLLPMIPQAGKQHIYDFFDVFGRLASWSSRNPGHVLVVHLVHLHAGVYSLFHRLYGMFPCNFISYLRLHYSMKENLDTFQEVVKPMLEHVRVHPELVTGTQDYELDPSRWRCYEVHDIVIECSRVSLDPLESSCEEDLSSSSSQPHLELTCSSEALSSSGCPAHQSLSSSHIQVPHLSQCVQADDVTWSPSSHCGLSTPPPEPAATGSTPLDRCTSISGVRSSVFVPVAPPPDVVPSPDSQGKQPITERQERAHGDVISSSEDVQLELPPPSSEPRPLTSTPCRDLLSPPPPCLLPPHTLSLDSLSGPALADSGSAPPYEQLFELALPRAASLFVEKKTQEALQRAGGQQGGGLEEEQVSPLKVLDQLIVHGHDAHQHLSNRFSAGSKSGDRSLSGGLTQGEELQCVRSQLLLVHSQLQYERFKRQQHAIRNRRLLRRVISTTALEEHSVAMRELLSVQDDEIRSLKTSLEEEQRLSSELLMDTNTHIQRLQTHNTHLELQQQEEQRHTQRLQSELQECQSRLGDVEAELQRANNKVYNAERQLTQLSLKLSSSEQLQQQMFLQNQQLVLLRETNRVLTEQLEGGETQCCSEASMLQCTVGKDYQRLKDSDVQLRQKLEAANHRISELETHLSKKEQLIQDQKKLLEDTKNHSRAELSASDSRCVALRTANQTLQMEMLHLYSQTHLDEGSRPNGGSVALPVAQGNRPRPSSSAVGILNGTAEALSTSPLHRPSCSSSPIDSPLAVGSFLEQQARQLFRPANQSQEEDETTNQSQEEEEEEEEEAQPGSPPLGQEVEEEASLLTGSPQTEPPGQTAAPDLTLAVRHRRHELSIMDYDETLPEF